MLIAMLSSAQEKLSTEEILKNGLKINLTEDGKNFAKIGFGTQIWARYSEFNTRAHTSLDADFGYNKDGDFDISLRRTFFNFYYKFNRFTIFSMIGISSQNRDVSTNNNNGATFFLYDTWASYRLVDKHLTVGMGLNMYSGLSRYSSSSSSQSLGVDVPFIACPDITTNSQNARHLGFFATGKFGILDYRITVATPFVKNGIPESQYDSSKISPVRDVSYELPTDKLGVKGYFTLQFCEKETNAMPFKTGTYIGKKKVFNLGFGFDYQPKSSIIFDEENTYKINDKLHLAADIFMDLPFTNGGALTFYTGIFKLNYGKNYLISYGIMDKYKQLSEPQQGTGYAMNSQIAYLIPSKANTRVQAYYIFDYKKYQALNDEAFHHNMGVNIFIAGHKAKFGLEYQLRPYFADGKNFDSYRGTGVFKMSFAI
jgi:hypothetical protein